MRYITRTIPVTTISCARVSLKDAAPLLEAMEPVVIKGFRVPSEKCLAKVRSHYGHSGAFVVTGVEYTQDLYRMPVDEFMARATLAERGSQEGDLSRQGE